MNPNQMRYFGLVSMSEDAIGVNSQLADAVHGAHGSVVEAHGQRHSNLYSTSALVAVPEAHVHDLSRAFERLAKNHIVHLRPAEAPADDLPTSDGDAEVLLYSFDHRGIVADFSGALLPIRASIVRYGANRMSAAENGAPLFVAKFVIRLDPADPSIVALTDALSDLADQHGYDFDVTPIQARDSVSRQALGRHQLIH